MKHNNLDCHLKKKRCHYFQSFNVQNLMQIDDASKMINIQNLGIGKIFFKCLFSLIKCTPFPFIIGMIIILIVKREKKFEIGRIHFYNTFVHLWFKCVFDLHENHEF